MSLKPDKKTILTALVAHFEKQVELFMRSAQAAYENATHEDSKAENKYDTRGLEASYMASSQSKRVLEAQQTLKILRDMPVRHFSEEDTIAMGAAVCLEWDDKTQIYLVAPRGGGTRLTVEGVTVLVITAASPLGKGLLGSVLDDDVCVGDRDYVVTDIW